MTRALAAACLAAACGGGAAGITGTVKGQTFAAADTVSGNSNSTGYILLASVAGLCAEATAGKQPKSVASLIITVQDVNLSTFATTPPAEIGTYTLSGSAPHFAAVEFRTTDASCAAIAAKSASGATGTVTLTSASGGAYSGSFDVIFDSGDHLTGPFSATACAGLAAVFESGTPPACN